MKIGITCYPTYGGSGVVGAELGVELAERGHEVHFIASALPFRAKGNQSLIYFHEVEMMSYPLFEHLPYALALSTKMAEVVQAYDLDVLHVHYAIPHSVSAFLARSMLLPRKIPFITTLHGTDITLVGMDRSYWGITKFAIEQSDGITAISNQLKQKTLEVFGIEKNIEVIYNFVNCNKYRRNANPEYRKLFAAEGEKILVHLSNFRPVKRTSDVVEIFSLVREKVPCRLILIGDGPDRSAAELLIHKKGLQQHAFFLGKQENVEDTLGISDVLLLPSELESFGLAALEAMACEAPPIASRVGGLPELVTHGVDGFLAEVGDVKAMADYAVRLLLDNELRQQMSKAGRQTAETRFCSTLIIPQYEKLYRRVAERDA
ncbi:MAG: N-acetyl-alpha-D-glucosaminyl L-malate synthase BshA [Acidobacteria bacterium RIFCSPLOWO2_12_FULL_54_10]|nr:MAG: N-acetyl-alpha-D-glucosaminyl L-malate synthase BshA [Acidobacteria bacterium RIFCSPLOWO2_12_FULL_54_10]